MAINNNQAAEVIKAAFKQATGSTALDTLDLEGIIDAGKSGEFTPEKEPFTKALISVLTKNWFTDSSYRSVANPNVSQEQKSSAQDGITKVNSQRNSIMIAENLIKNKGFQDIIIFVNNESVSAVVRSDNLETADIAQIQSIIQSL